MNLDTITSVPADSVRWIYHWGYYDGPLSGAVEVNGERLWTTCKDENDDGSRTFILTRLSDAEWAKENERNDFFEKHVGTHNNYSGKGKVRPEGEWHIYYDKYPPRTFTEPTGEVIGKWNDMV